MNCELMDQRGAWFASWKLPLLSFSKIQYRDAYGFSKLRNIHKVKPRGVYKFLTEALPITWRVDTDQVYAKMFWIEHKGG